MAQVGGHPMGLLIARIYWKTYQVNQRSTEILEYRNILIFLAKTGGQKKVE